MSTKMSGLDLVGALGVACVLLGGAGFARKVNKSVARPAKRRFPTHKRKNTEAPLSSISFE